MANFRNKKGKLKEYDLTGNRYKLSESFPEIKQITVLLVKTPCLSPINFI